MNYSIIYHKYYTFPNFPNKRKSIMLRYEKILSLKNVPICFLVCSNYFCIFISINKVSQGLQNPEIMKIAGFCVSNNKT